MFRFLAIVLILASGPVLADDLVGPVDRVSDGDTLVIAGERIRLWGIDAPESEQSCTDRRGAEYACGKVSKRALEALVRGRKVSCALRSHDRYGRPVAQCAVGGQDIGAAMVAAGHAVDFTDYSRGFYAGPEADAQSAGRGLWQGVFVRPAEWRQANRR